MTHCLPLLPFLSRTWRSAPSSSSVFIEDVWPSWKHTLKWGRRVYVQCHLPAVLEGLWIFPVCIFLLLPLLLYLLLTCYLVVMHSQIVELRHNLSTYPQATVRSIPLEYPCLGMILPLQRNAGQWAACQSPFGSRQHLGPVPGTAAPRFVQWQRPGAPAEPRLCQLLLETPTVHTSQHQHQFLPELKH